jgi:sugar phosphate isomerase/epimerase
MCVEGGGDGWRMGIDMLGPRIAVVAVKDLDWACTDDAALGKPRWYTRMVPLREGVVPWPSVFACLKQVGFNGWVSLHSEYQGRHTWRNLTTPEVIEQTRQDLTFIRTEVLPRVNAASTGAVSRRGPSNPCS